MSGMRPQISIDMLLMSCDPMPGLEMVARNKVGYVIVIGEFVNKGVHMRPPRSNDGDRLRVLFGSSRVRSI